MWKYHYDPSSTRVNRSERDLTAMWEYHIYDPSSTSVTRSERDFTAMWEYHNTVLAVQVLTDHRVISQLCGNIIYMILAVQGLS